MKSALEFGISYNNKKLQAEKLEYGFNTYEINFTPEETGVYTLNLNIRDKKEVLEKPQTFFISDFNIKRNVENNLQLTADNLTFVPQVLSYNDYYPFGMLVPERNNPLNTTNNGGYRYGFQGQELDDEIKGKKGTSLNYKYRMHDPRVGRFFAVDPLATKYPWYTPYQFSGNKVIAFAELEGLEEGFAILGGKIVKVTGPTKEVLNSFETKEMAQIGLSLDLKTPKLLNDYMSWLENPPPSSSYMPNAIIQAEPTAQEIMNANPDFYLGAQTSIGGGIGIGLREMITDELAFGVLNKISKSYKIWKASRLTKSTIKTTRNLTHPEFIDNVHEVFSVWKTAQKKAISNINNSGKAILGSFPEYIKFAKKNGHSYFDIGKTWEELAKNGQNVWEINKLFLDRVAKQGDEIIIILGKNKKPGKYLKDEINYLINKKGYMWKNAKKTILTPKPKG